MFIGPNGPAVENRPSSIRRTNHGAGCKAGNPVYLGRVRISIIVPAFNEAKLLGASLAEIRAAAAAFTPLGWEFELVVCDNNSTDGTADIARAAGAKVVLSRSTRSPARATPGPPPPSATG